MSRAPIRSRSSVPGQTAIRDESPGQSATDCDPTGSTQPRAETLDGKIESPLDFTEFLARRLGTTRGQALHVLGHWLLSYEPQRRRAIEGVDPDDALPKRIRPTTAGVRDAGPVPNADERAAEATHLAWAVGS